MSTDSEGGKERMLVILYLIDYLELVFDFPLDAI